jgi:hypothetical protein
VVLAERSQIVGSADSIGSNGSADRRAPAGGGAEEVERPPPGIARGRWEAPAWVFWFVAAAALAFGIVWMVVALRGRRGER